MSGRPQCSRRKAARLAPAAAASPASGSVAISGASPTAAAWRAAASRARRLLAITSRDTRANARSPGFGVSIPRPSSADRSRLAGGGRDPLPKRGGLQQASDLGGGSRVGDAWPRADRGQVVADHIGNDEDSNGGRRKRARQLPAAPSRESFPNLVHRGDVEARTQEQRVQGGEVARRESGLGRADETGGAAREQDPHLVVGSDRGRPSVPALPPRPTTRTLVRGDRRRRREARGAVRRRPRARR